MDRGQTIRNKNRQEKAREAYISKIESKLQQAEEKIRALEASQKKELPVAGVYSRSAVIILCVNIYLFGRISFSSIPRVLSQLSLGSWIGSVGNLVSAPQSYNMTVESSVYDTLESYVNS